MLVRSPLNGRCQWGSWDLWNQGWAGWGCQGECFEASSTGTISKIDSNYVKSNGFDFFYISNTESKIRIQARHDGTRHSAQPRSQLCSQLRPSDSQPDDFFVHMPLNMYRFLYRYHCLHSLHIYLFIFSEVYTCYMYHWGGELQRCN